MTLAQVPFLFLRIVGIFSFFLTAFNLYGIIRTLSAKSGKKYVFLIAALFLCSAGITQGFSQLCKTIDNNGPLTAFLQLFLSLPAAGTAAAIGLLTAASAAAFLIIQKRISNTLTPASIQEGLDRMPDGVCFGTEEGIPLLVNRKMQEISAKTLKTAVLDTENLSRLIGRETKNERYAVEKRGAGTFLHLDDGSIWDVRKNELTLLRKKGHEYIAYDVTEQYQKSAELEMRNEHLSVVNEKLRAYSQNLDAIIREREILAAKIKLHDDIGRSLLSLRSYLSQEHGDRDALVSLWKFTAAVLRREAVTPDEENRFEVLSQAARAVDVELVFDGKIPEEFEEVTALAVHECLTNTVKHGNGTKLTVKAHIKNGKYILELSNDGAVPASPIKEKGGLKNLRTTVEMGGGEMETEIRPRFVLRIIYRTAGKTADTASSASLTNNAGE